MDGVNIAPDEATRQVETILNLEREKVITVEEARAAVKKVQYYSELFGEAAN